MRDVIARELCSNLLMHREYSNPYTARLIITKDAILTENANKPKTIGYIDINNYTPYTKNPKIAGVFKEIGLADELGSGIKKITYFTKIYSGGIPEFKDDEVFKVSVPLINNKFSENGNDFGNDIGNENEKKILAVLSLNPCLTQQQISEKTGLAKRTISRIIKKLKYEQTITRIGSDRKGYWKVNQNTDIK